MNKRIKLFYIPNAPLIIVNTIISLFIIFAIIHKEFIFEILNINADKSEVIITVSSIFAGFSFNSLNNISSYRNTSDFKNLDRDGYLNRFYNSIYVTLFWFILDIFISIICYLINKKYSNSSLYILEIMFMVSGIIMFIFQIIQFKMLLNWLKNKKF